MKPATVYEWVRVGRMPCYRLGPGRCGLTSLAGSMRRRGMSEAAICAALVAELPRCQQRPLIRARDFRALLERSTYDGRTRVR